MRIWRFCLVWLGLAVYLLVPAPTQAANFNYQTSVTYRVEGNQTQVSEDYTVINRTPRQYLTQLRVATPTKKVTSVDARYSDGAVIPATLSTASNLRNGLKYEHQVITLKFPRANYGSGRRWQFKLRYNAEGLVDTKGSAHTVYIPSIDPGEPADTYQAVLDVPASFGKPHFSGAQSHEGGVVGDRQRYSFTKAELVDHSLALAFGDATVYRTNFNFPLHNPTPLPRTLTITLPPDLSNQRVYIEKLDPAPTNTRLDADGNVLAEYRLRPGQKITVQTQVFGVVRYLSYDLSASGTQREIPADLIKKYTAATRYWPTNGKVAAATKQIIDSQAPTIANVKAIYQYVIDKLSYNDEKIKFNIRQGASQALANPTNAVCLEYADLMVAMLRSAGIPARMPIGYGYSNNLKQTQRVEDSLHSWVEAYVPGIGWMMLDPTWGEKFDQFGRSDLDHFAFSVWGSADERPAALMWGQQDLNYQYEQTALDFLAEHQPVAARPQVKLNRFLILPFVWLEQAQIVTAAGAATDSNWLQLGEQRFELGSLAPLQRVSVNRLSLESRADLPVRLGYAGETALVAGVTQRHYWPAWALLGATLIAAVIWIVLRLRAHDQEHFFGEEAV